LTERTQTVGLTEPRDIAIRIADIIADTPASQTIVLDIRGLTAIADFFVVCSGENERQLRAISSEVRDKLEEAGVKPIRSEEGTTSGGWIVLDYGAVIVHVLDVDQRAFYRLEELWAEAPALLTIE
jgi:ribosome-associated protein